MRKWQRWLWLVIPVALTVWVLVDFISGARYMVGRYIGLPLDKLFYSSMESMVKNVVVWLYAVWASTICSIVIMRKGSLTT
jgi:F0F1-type ATP synthase assembly protein I